MLSSRLVSSAACLLALLVLAGCGNSKSEQPAVPPTSSSQEATAPEKPSAKFQHREFPNARTALETLLAETDPVMVGFGEFHQTTGTTGTTSTIERFTEALLPLISASTTDLLVETWVSEGKCGDTEKAVVGQVEKVSNRPEQTEDENLVMLKRAKELGVQPHILTMTCADYDKVHVPDGGVDYLEMLELVARRLGEKSSQILKERQAGKKTGRVAVFCGAIHNDTAPSPDFETFSFAPAAQAASGNRYLEVDLYVPEFVMASESAKEEKWYPLVVKLASQGGAHLIKLSENSYIILLASGKSKKTLTTT